MLLVRITVSVQFWNKTIDYILFDNRGWHLFYNALYQLVIQFIFRHHVTSHRKIATRPSISSDG